MTTPNPGEGIMRNLKHIIHGSDRLWKLSSLVAAAALVAAAGCSEDTVAPAGSVSDQAKVEASQRTTEVLSAQQLAQRATAVEDLVGGFDVGIAGDAAGVGMEIGAPIPGLSMAKAPVSFGDNLSSASRGLQRQRKRLAQVEIASMAKAPGDLLFEETVTNPDQSQTHTQVFEDSPASVVRVVQETTWPQGNLILTSITNEIFVDRGADLSSDLDDTWLSISNSLVFVNGSSLSRVVDARDLGGLQDNLRVDLVSTWIPRPGHPRLLDSVTTLTVDLGQLDLPADDRFVSVRRVTRMLGTAFDGGSPRVVESLIPESPIAEGEEPCGGEVSRDLRFRNDRAVRRWTDTASWACAGGGSLSRTVTYADASVDEVTITEGTDGIVHLNATNHDGTIVSGSYDEASHQFDVTVTHPTGSDPVRETLSGSTNANETSWQLDSQVEYADGFIERGHLEGLEDSTGEHLSGNFVGRDESVSFSLDSSPDESRLVGHVENSRQEIFDFEVERLPDGGSLVHFEAQEPGRVVVGDLEIDVDGCGTGTIEVTEGDEREVFDISFCDGEMDAGPLAGL